MNNKFHNSAKLNCLYGDFLLKGTFDDLNNSLKKSNITNLYVIVTLGIIHPKKINQFEKINYQAIKNIYEISQELNVNLHIDGARVWHAILQEKSSLNYGSVCDSLTFCFSKALGAPIGSMLLGSKEFIKDAREYRKILGGGTRQVGVIASMANKALDKRQRLLEDHLKAKQVDFKKMRKGGMSKADFIKKYPKAI